MTVSGSCDQKQLRVTSPFCLHRHCPICFQTQSIVFRPEFIPAITLPHIWNEVCEIRDRSGLFTEKTDIVSNELPLSKYFNFLWEAGILLLICNLYFYTLYCVCLVYSEISDILMGQLQSTAIIIAVYEIWYCTGNILVNVTHMTVSESAVK